MSALRDLNDGERAAYFRGIQPIWGGGLDEPRFQLFQRRLADSGEARGRYRLLGWFDGPRLLSALKAYDLAGLFRGARLRLLGIGAVFTPPEQRRQGHAAALLRAVLDEYRLSGAHAAVLFSDIDAAYYGRLGFLPLESRESSVDLGQLPKLANGFRSAMAGDEEPMSRLFAGAQEGTQHFSFFRDGWTLRFQLRRLRELARARGVGEPEWGIMDTAGEGAAMLRFGRDAVDVLDAAWTSERGRERVLSGLRDCLTRSGRTKLRVWPAAQLRGLYPAEPRASALAMFAPLSQGAPPPAPDAAVDFALLDHI